ncbi:Zinc finger, RING/FYVE/PHD-type [Phytophthora cactorum]|nr:Zinc finger, RING/FYVE/PHD-type [Phytophthora cactorum]
MLKRWATLKRWWALMDGWSCPRPAALSSPVKRISEAQRTDECVICFDGPQEAVCVPCGHNAVCMDCAQELLDTTRLCPVCRQQVREVIRLYRV